MGLRHDKISLAFKPSVSAENNTFLVPRRQLLNPGFSSANVINPLIFRHLPDPNHDFCIVNNGDPLNAGAIVQFRYFNTFMFNAFSVSSVTCVP
ncbi:hypothetical protein Dsin_007128 [Dipteronia sinensis]|uniref:Uncharacterized protein n=1 Tax=Dipteronia sinensis TaxID=43782 RepID=A0AAE0AZX8_9ROSI|nr:hypothetical protein Dsin_007128 [Dipteronia sinensis]